MPPPAPRRTPSVLVASSTLAALGALTCPGLLHAASYTNVKVNTLANSPEECSIAIRPTHPDEILAGAQSGGSRFYRSTDGGATWSDAALPGQYDLGDPVAIYDADGKAYFSYIGTFNHSGIFVNRSIDGGATWTATATPVIEHAGSRPFEDKEWIACDWSFGPRRGWLYVCWTQFDVYGSTAPQDSSRILFSRSTDGGVSYAAPIRINDLCGNAIDSDDTVEGAVPAVGPEGTIYVAWAGPRGIEFDSSTDGGLTWGRDRILSDLPGGWDFPVSGLYRCNGLPVTETDVSYGPYRGRVYVHWVDHRNGDPDLFLVYSDDGGATWSARRRINDDPIGNGEAQFMSWLDVDPVTGTVYAVFYDRRDQIGDTTDVYIAWSEDGGDHWVNEKVSAATFTPNPSIFFGDYIGISAWAGRVRPVWTRMDSFQTSIWTALVERPAVGVEDVVLLPEHGSPAAPALGVAPNPVRCDAEIRLVSSAVRPRFLLIADARGRVVRRLAVEPGSGARLTHWDGRDAAGRDASAGVYFVAPERGPATRVVVVR